MLPGGKNKKPTKYYIRPDGVACTKTLELSTYHIEIWIMQPACHLFLRAWLLLPSLPLPNLTFSRMLAVPCILPRNFSSSQGGNEKKNRCMHKKNWDHQEKRFAGKKKLKNCGKYSSEWIRTPDLYKPAAAVIILSDLEWILNMLYI